MLRKETGRNDGALPKSTLSILKRMSHVGTHMDNMPINNRTRKQNQTRAAISVLDPVAAQRNLPHYHAEQQINQSELAPRAFSAVLRRLDLLQ